MDGQDTRFNHNHYNRQTFANIKLSIFRANSQKCLTVSSSGGGGGGASQKW